jgi:hypothetical protein
LQCKIIAIRIVAAGEQMPHFQTIFASGEKSWRRGGRSSQTQRLAG